MVRLSGLEFRIVKLLPGTPGDFPDFDILDLQLGAVGGEAYMAAPDGVRVKKIKDIEIREIAWRPRKQLYDPEF